MESAMSSSPSVVPSNAGVGQPCDIQPMRNVAPVLVTPTSMQSEQVESVPYEAFQPVLLNEGCLDIDSQDSKGDNFESQLRDTDKELTKFDNPSTPQLVTSSAVDRVEAPLPLPRIPLDRGEISSTSIRPTKMSTWTRLVRTTVDSLTPSVLAKMGMESVVLFLRKIAPYYLANVNRF